jgi:hypothetical protein
LAALSYWLFPSDQAGRGPSDVAAKRERERERVLVKSVESVVARQKDVTKYGCGGWKASAGVFRHTEEHNRRV